MIEAAQKGTLRRSVSAALFSVACRSRARGRASSALSSVATHLGIDPSPTHSFLMGSETLKIPSLRRPFCAAIVLASLALLFAIFAGIWFPIFNVILHQQVNKAVALSGPVRTFPYPFQCLVLVEANHVLLVDRVVKHGSTGTPRTSNMPPSSTKPTLSIIVPTCGKYYKVACR